MTRLHCLHCDDDIPLAGSVPDSIAAHVDQAHIPITHAWLPDRDYVVELPPPTSELDDPAFTSTLSIRAATGVTGPEVAYDYVIVVIPEGLAAPAPATPATPRIEFELLMLSKRFEASVKLPFRGAAWWVTRSALVVEQRVENHCPTCQAAGDQAKAMIRDKPETVVAIGRFSFAASDA